MTDKGRKASEEVVEVRIKLTKENGKIFQALVSIPNKQNRSFKAKEWLIDGYNASEEKVFEHGS
jgi:hypothetical protein